MLAVAAIGVIALAGAVIAGVTWRRGLDERQSVRQHQSALDTLRQVSDRVEETRVRPSSRSARSARQKRGAQGRPVVARVPKPTTAREPPARHAGAADGAGVDDPGATPPMHDAEEGDGPETRPPLVFDDAAPAIPPARELDSGDPAARRAIARMGGTGQHSWPARSTSVALVAAVVLVVVGALAAVGLAHRSSPPGRAPVRTTTTAPVTTTPTVVEPIATSPSAATYGSPSGSFTVVLSAAGDCWVMAVDATGKVVWTGTMTAGQVQPLTTTSGTLKVDLGAASDVTVTLQGRPVALPTAFRSPFVATFTSNGQPT